MFSLSSESFVLPLLLALVSLALWAAKPLLIPRVRTYKRAAQIQDLLGPPGVSLESLLQARAIPNQRLVHAFRLTNTFVSGDSEVHRTFTTNAKALIAGSRAGTKDNRWRTVAQNAESAARRFLPTHRGSSVDFATLIQSITFSVVLVALFDTDPDALVYRDVVYVTNIINQRWKDSKSKDADVMEKDDSLCNMKAQIRQWVADRDRYPNPVDFILPAYETLWRVVAVLVGQVMHHVYHCHNNTLHDTVMGFERDPTEERFSAFGKDENGYPSMEAIVLEVLRLHPPTRHISRTRIESQSGTWWKTLLTPAIEIADIESVQLSDDYGTSTSEFNPMRFHPSRGRPKLYAFGYGKLKCVAAGWAPMAAAVIAAKVVSQIKEAECTVTVGHKIGGRNGWDEWVVRKETE